MTPCKTFSDCSNGRLLSLTSPVRITGWQGARVAVARHLDTPRLRDLETTMRPTLLVTLLLAATAALALPPENVDRPITHYVLVLQHPLQPAEVSDLQSKGVIIGRTLGANRYMVRVSDLDAVAGDARVRSLEPFDGSR